MKKKYIMVHTHRHGVDTFLIQTEKDLPVSYVLIGDELKEYETLVNKVTELEIERDETIEFNLVEDTFIDID